MNEVSKNSFMKLNDDDLLSVIGGTGQKDYPETNYHVGDVVEIWIGDNITTRGTITEMYKKKNGRYRYRFSLDNYFYKFLSWYASNTWYPEGCIAYKVN